MRKHRPDAREARSPRVTIISRIYTPEPSAGSMRLQALSDEMVRRGFRVRVLTTRPPRSIPVAPCSGEDVRRWPVLRDKAGYVRGYLQYLSYDVPLFFRVLFSSRPDVYVVEPPPTTGAVARVATWIRRRPYVYYAADIWSDAAQMTGSASWVIKAVRAVEKIALRGAAVNLVVSEGVAERIDTLAPNASSIVVGHGVDTELFSPEGSAIESASDIVYVGTMSEWHGAGIAVDALAVVMRNDRMLTATFIGQGADKDAMRASVEAYGLNDRIRFLPPVPAEEAAQWVRSARVALATLKPGAGYDFAIPTKLYAAMATGTPVAYAGPRALRDLIEENALGETAAFLPDEYAAAIDRLLARSDGRPMEHLVAWAQRNVSARAVAERATAAVEAVVRRRSHERI